MEVRPRALQGLCKAWVTSRASAQETGGGGGRVPGWTGQSGPLGGWGWVGPGRCRVVVSPPILEWEGSGFASWLCDLWAV